MKQAIIMAVALGLGVLLGAERLQGEAGAAGYQPLKVEGGFENAQLHGVRIENPTAEEPTVVIGGTLKDKPNKAVARRHPHKYFHWHIKLTGIDGRTVRIRFGPVTGQPQVLSLMTPVVYYDLANKRYELAHDVRLERVFLGSRNEDRDKSDYWGSVLEFRHRFRKDTAYVAKTFPFTNDDATQLAEEVGRHPHGTASEIGKSRFDKIPLRQIVVTDPATADSKKKGVWLYAGEDPWEFPGNIACAATVRWATSNDPLAREFRRRFVLSVIPIVQPDAVNRGWTNYSLDEGYKQIINFGGTWDRTDIPEKEAIKQAVRKWKADGRTIDYCESMHSSLNWGSFLRLNYGDKEKGQRLVGELICKKYMPWYTFSQVGKPYTGLAKPTSFAAFTSTMFPDHQSYSSHTEQILFSIKSLPGMPTPQFPKWGKTQWTDEDTRNMRGHMIPHRRVDIEQMGVYRLLAMMEFYGEKIDAKQLPPQLLCGDVDGYASVEDQARTFTVLYRDVANRPAKAVTLHLADGSRHEMKRDAGTSPLHAIRFKVTVPITKSDQHDFHFTADNGTTLVRYPPNSTFLGPYVSEE